MKKKNAFTLIELLAIIVILAIIAVITVPIILNIIENSKKGAVTDSAYGFKDAVNKYYLSELSKNPDLAKLNGEYTVTNGKLTKTGTSEEINVETEGTKPTSGTLTYENNVLKSGCIVMEGYAVTFNGNETSTVKGTCSSQNGQGGNTPTQTAVSPVVYRNNGGTISDNADTNITAATDLNVGDYVKLGDNDGFYVIKKPEATDETVLLLAKYNISNTTANTGYNIQNNGIMLMSNKTYVAEGEASATWRQTKGDRYVLTAFSEEFYWKDCVAINSDSEYTCETPYRQKYSSEEYAYVYDSHSKLQAPMENYKDYLETATGLTLTVRPMAYSEAYSIIDYSWAYSYNQSYWLGSENYNGVWFVSWNYPHLNTRYYDGNDGIRPVIEISASLF